MNITYMPEARINGRGHTAYLKDQYKLFRTLQNVDPYKTDVWWRDFPATYEHYVTRVRLATGDRRIVDRDAIRTTGTTTFWGRLDSLEELRVDFSPPPSKPSYGNGFYWPQINLMLRHSFVLPWGECNRDFLKQNKVGYKLFGDSANIMLDYGRDEGMIDDRDFTVAQASRFIVPRTLRMQTLLLSQLDSPRLTWPPFDLFVDIDVPLMADFRFILADKWPEGAEP